MDNPKLTEFSSSVEELAKELGISSYILACGVVEQKDFVYTGQTSGGSWQLLVLLKDITSHLFDMLVGGTDETS